MPKMKAKLAALSPEEQHALNMITFREFLRAGMNRRALLLRWTRECIALAEELESAPTSTTAALFCIRAGGVFTDVYTWARDGAEYDEPTDDDLLHAFEAIVAAVDALRAMISDDEALWLHYTRDAEAHPWLESYSHESEGQSVTFGKSSAVAARDVTFLEFQAAVARVNATHGTLERVSAVIAAKMLPGLKGVHAAADLFRQ